jgi:endonuclease V-like protein UPF0215 family
LVDRLSGAKRVFRVVKNEIRVLGVDDGKFTPKTRGTVLVVGVVFRGGTSVEAVMHAHVAVDGLDATTKLTTMILGSPHHRQIRLIMLSGLTFGGFNLVDIQQLHAKTGLPVLVVTSDKPNLEAIHTALTNLPNAEERWRIVQAAGEIHEVPNRDGKVYVELAGISLDEAKTVLAVTSTRSSLPEPIRVAHLVASGVSPQNV